MFRRNLVIGAASTCKTDDRVMPNADANRYGTDWDRVIREAVEIMVGDQGCSADYAERAIRQALNSSPPVPFPEN